MASADSTVETATKIMKHEYSELKTKGETGIRIEVENCYKKLGDRSSLQDIKYCYLLDYTSNELDESVRRQLGIAEDPTGFHGDENSLKRVIPALVRIHMDKDDVVSLIGVWTKAAMIANNR